MRVLVIGQAAFGQDTFEALRKDGHAIVAVAVPLLSLSGRPERLRVAAEAAGVPTYEIRALRDAATQEQLRPLGIDLAVMAYVTDIIPGAVIALPRHGTIEYHPSLLPAHRGRSAINWSIVNGDKETGATIFWVDDNVDTGPVLLQRSVPIEDDITASQLYNEHLYPIGLTMIAEAARMVANGDIIRIPQDESRATYEQAFSDRHARIDWTKPSRAVHNLIRGAQESPGAWTTLDGHRLLVFDSRHAEADRTRLPGTVSAVAGEGLLVGATGGSLLIGRLKTESDAAPLPAAQFAEVHGIRDGTRFGD